MNPRITDVPSKQGYLLINLLVTCAVLALVLGIDSYSRYKWQKPRADAQKSQSGKAIAKE